MSDSEYSMSDSEIEAMLNASGPSSDEITLAQACWNHDYKQNQSFFFNLPLCVIAQCMCFLDCHALRHSWAPCCRVFQWLLRFFGETLETTMEKFNEGLISSGAVFAATNASSPKVCTNTSCTNTLCTNTSCTNTSCTNGSCSNASTQPESKVASPSLKELFADMYHALQLKELSHTPTYPHECSHSPQGQWPLVSEVIRKQQKASWRKRKAAELIPNDVSHPHVSHPESDKLTSAKLAHLDLNTRPPTDTHTHTHTHTDVYSEGIQRNFNNDGVRVPAEIVQVVREWRSRFNFPPLDDFGMETANETAKHIGHKCARGKCRVDVIGDVYLCRVTGRHHVCADFCTLAQRDRDGSLHVTCPVSGRCFVSVPKALKRCQGVALPLWGEQLKGNKGRELEEGDDVEAIHRDCL
eukprot:GHVR01042759.1.p1 GENE.GHVR01042759.1~~GHVR01042759.1.p1  ORF type:complete len:411 (+),score=77.59 GHVR01042759.1:1317-2549(+)